MPLIPLPFTDGRLDYDPGFLPPAEADRLLAVLLETLALARHTINLFGRRVVSPRLTAFYGDAGADYTYSGLRLAPRPWTAELAGLRDGVQRASGHAFNSVLCNLYRDGRDSMGWHSDDEPELGPEPVIASISLGAVRRFVLRHKKRRAPSRVLELDHGSLLLMSGPTQAHWKHALPRTAVAVGPRLNLTFRLIVDARQSN